MNHQKILEILPWYANETLREKERRRVESHLAECQACATDLPELDEIGRATRELAQETPEPSPTGLQRAVAEIERFERTRGSAGLFTRLTRQVTRFLTPLAESWRPLPAYARVAIAAQFLLIVGLAMFVASRPNDREHRLATGPADPHKTGEIGARLLVAFQPGIREEELRQVVLAAQGQIVSGPDSNGIYTIGFPIPAKQGEQVERLRQELEKKTALIRFAQRAP